VIQATADMLLTPSAARERLTTGIARDAENEGLKRLARAFELVAASEPIRDRMKALGIRDPQAALERGVISKKELADLAVMMEAVKLVVAVDDFAPEEVSAIYKGKGEGPSKPKARPRPPKSQPEPNEQSPEEAAE
jgi:acyl-CoA dehydrogenase